MSPRASPHEESPYTFLSPSYSTAIRPSRVVATFPTEVEFQLACHAQLFSFIQFMCLHHQQFTLRIIQWLHSEPPPSFLWQLQVHSMCTFFFSVPLVSTLLLGVLFYSHCSIICVFPELQATWSQGDLPSMDRHPEHWLWILFPFTFDNLYIVN